MATTRSARKLKKPAAQSSNANQKYTEAVAVAAEKCAEDTKGQTCYICTQALHWKTKEGLVRGCSCRGTAGFAHVSCLAEQAKILMAEAEENNLDARGLRERGNGGTPCGLCEQKYHGVVKRCALGWAFLEDVRGSAREDQVSWHGDEPAWERFTRWRTLRGRVVRARGPAGYEAATWRIQKVPFLSRRAILLGRITCSDGLKRPFDDGETYTLDG